MEVETEANVYEPFEEYVKQVEVKQLKLFDSILLLLIIEAVLVIGLQKHTPIQLQYNSVGILI
jgi:hypothetical protein